MALDTNTAKTNNTGEEPVKRWFRAPSFKSEFDYWLDAYWGGPERRITGLTLRIIAVNVIALVLLVFGVIYLGQYQKQIIKAKLETFESSVNLMALALVEGAQQGSVLSKKDVDRILFSLGQTINQKLVVYDINGEMFSDSYKILRSAGLEPERKITRPYDTIYFLRDVLQALLFFVPDKRTLQVYREENFKNGFDYPDVQNAYLGETSFSAWMDENDHIILMAAAPLIKNGKLSGVVHVIRQASDIEAEISQMWRNIFLISLMTFFITILLSIYLSGVIARPLKKLAHAAEGVRKGKLSYEEIPDLRSRHDEIGELSIALRQMTSALGSRIDSIDKFAADVAHELKNPLTSLRSAAETFAVVKNKKDREQLMQIVMHDIERMDRLITDISRASRLDAELSREAFFKIDAIKVLEDVLNLYQVPLSRVSSASNAAEKTFHIQGKTIRFLGPKGPVYAWGVDSKLAQVYENILSNALSFSPEKAEITIQAKISDSKLRVTFEDQGPGLPENKLQTIFERFYSERPQHESYGKHSGLGLSIAKQIVDAMGGEIFAENHKNKTGAIGGARFTVVFNLV